jgi:hypothetical protein
MFFITFLLSAALRYGVINNTAGKGTKEADSNYEVERLSEL